MRKKKDASSKRNILEELGQFSDCSDDEDSGVPLLKYENEPKAEDWTVVTPRSLLSKLQCSVDVTRDEEGSSEIIPCRSISLARQTVRNRRGRLLCTPGGGMDPVQSPNEMEPEVVSQRAADSSRADVSHQSSRRLSDLEEDLKRVKQLVLARKQMVLARKQKAGTTDSTVSYEKPLMEKHPQVVNDTPQEMYSANTKRISDMKSDLKHIKQMTLSKRQQASRANTDVSLLESTPSENGYETRMDISGMNTEILAELDRELEQIKQKMLRSSKEGRSERSMRIVGVQDNGENKSFQEYEEDDYDDEYTHSQYSTDFSENSSFLNRGPSLYYNMEMIREMRREPLYFYENTSDTSTNSTLDHMAVFDVGETLKDIAVLRDLRREEAASLILKQFSCTI